MIYMAPHVYRCVYLQVLSSLKLRVKLQQFVPYNAHGHYIELQCKILEKSTGYIITNEVDGRYLDRYFYAKRLKVSHFIDDVSMI